MGKPWTLDHGSSSHLGVFIFSSSLSPDPYLFPALPLYTSSCYTSKNCWARLASLQVSGLLVGKPLVSVWMKVCGFFSSLWIHWRFMINLRFFHLYSRGWGLASDWVLGAYSGPESFPTLFKSQFFQRPAFPSQGLAQWSWLYTQQQVHQVVC